MSRVPTEKQHRNRRYPTERECRAFQRRLKIQKAAFTLIAWLGAPILIPVIGLLVAATSWCKGLGWPRRDFAGRARRIWWVYGYHWGFYALDWRMKARATGEAEGE